MDLGAQQLDLPAQFGDAAAQLVAFLAQRGDGLPKLVVEGAHLVEDGVLLAQDGGGVVAVVLERGEDDPGDAEHADGEGNELSPCHALIMWAASVAAVLAPRPRGAGAGPLLD